MFKEALCDIRLNERLTLKSRGVVVGRLVNLDHRIMLGIDILQFSSRHIVIDMSHIENRKKFHDVS